MITSFIRIYTIVMVFAVSLFVGVDALAIQGFEHESDSFPKAMQTISKRIFMVYSKSKKQPRGTAFLVHNDGKKALFITARHVLIPEKEKDLTLSLKDLSLHSNGSWQNGVNDRFTSDMTLYPTELGGIQGGLKEFNSEKTTNDLGYFVTPSHPDLPLVSLSQLGESLKNKFDSDLSLTKHFIIGYPVLYHKDEAGSRIASIKLSLSQGNYLFTSSSNYKFMLESTADSRSGNSGSPVFTEDGRLLGVLVNGGLPKEYMSFPQMNSSIIPVDYLKKMLGDLLLNRKAGITRAKSCKGFFQPNF